MFALKLPFFGLQMAMLGKSFFSITWNGSNDKERTLSGSGGGHSFAAGGQKESEREKTTLQN